MEDLNENEVMAVVFMWGYTLKVSGLVLRDFDAKEGQEPLPRLGKLPAFNMSERL